MKIALLGATGAGKTELAKKLARNLTRDGKGKWVIVDAYVEDLAERTGREYGEKGWYSHHVQVMAERWTREAEALHKGYSTITCGSIYETIIYAALVNIIPPAGEKELLRTMHDTETAMKFFGLMEANTFNYNALFYLPLGQSDEKTWATVVDSKIPEVLDGYMRYAITLDEGTPRARTEHALGVIRSARDFTEDEQS